MAQNPTVDTESKNVNGLCDLVSEQTVTETNTNSIRKCSDSILVNHAGVLVFFEFIVSLQKHMSDDIRDFVIQLVVSILLRAQNIEQTKFLDFQSLSIFIANPIVNRNSQRLKLKTISTDENIYELLNYNSKLLNLESESDFYYDPHTKHYTGMRSILKSWCSSIRMADKVINSDFIHTTSGMPVYLSNGDTFDDMRVRFFRDVESFIGICKFSESKKITMCIDRGIFSADVFKKALSISNLSIVTWEKGYKNDAWIDDDKITLSGHLTRVRNNKNDVKTIHFQYQDGEWEKNKDIRKIIVRFPDRDTNDTLEVSILTDDKQRNCFEIIKLMLNRWVQENGFKYLRSHFGLDQITSYQYNEYQDIASAVNDKNTESAKYKSITKEMKKVKGKLKTSLNKKHEYDLKYDVYQDIAVALEGKSELYDKDLVEEISKSFKKKESKKNDKKINKKQKRNYQLIIEDILNKTEEYSILINQRKLAERYVSKTEELSANGIQKLNTQQKQLMDVIKIIAHNIFILKFEEFKGQYNNYRDDHMIFREISRADAILTQKENYTELSMIPKMNIPPQIEKIFTNIYDIINSKKLIINNNQTLKLKMSNSSIITIK